MATCPDASWTAAPANTPSWWTNLCYKSSQPVGALRDCFDACLPGAPACISSANETRYIVETVPFSNSFGAFGFHWLGERLLIDHNISSMVCLDGPANANWPAEARSWSPQLERYGGCISLMPGPRGQSVFDEGPCDWFAVAATPCLCATRLQPVAPSTETLAWLTAKREEILNELTPVAVRTFVIAVLLMLVPLACLLMGRCARRRKSPSRVYAAADAPDESSGASSDAASGALRDASSAAARVRVRVSGALAMLGWSLLMLSLVPQFARVGQEAQGNDMGLEPVIGSGAFWLVPLPPGLLLLLLAVLPTDKRAIRWTARAFFVALVLLLLVFLDGLSSSIANAANGFSGPQELIILVAWIVQCVTSTTIIILTVPTLRCGKRRMTPRAALQRLWLSMRTLVFIMGVPVLAFVVSVLVTPKMHYTTWPSYLAFVLSCFLSGLISSPSNRGRLRRRLGGLGARGSAEQEAAAIAALIGGRSPAAALNLATRAFRVLPLEQLSASDLASNEDTGMYARTRQAELGACDAFLSHSWRDSGDAKHAALVKWTQSSGSKTVWLDKACIAQHENIDEQLVALPVFCSGCKQLLILAGVTYPSRLWCVIKAFTYVKMVDDRTRIIVEPIGDGKVVEALAAFDAAKAQCFKPEERSQLLAVIESGLGDFYHFNRVMRGIFAASAKS